MLSIGFIVIALLVATVVVAASSVYLEHKKLLSLADGASVAAADLGKIALPPGAAALFIELRALMHGLVTLELLGHLHPFGDHGAALFEGAMHRMSAQVDAAQKDAER